MTQHPSTSSLHGAQLQNECILMAWYLVKHMENYTFKFTYSCRQRWNNVPWKAALLWLIW